MNPIHTIYLPTRPQPDTIVAIFLLQTFGRDEFPGIEQATVKIKHQLGDDESLEELLQQGYVTLDLGGGPLDHHDKDFCTAELVAKFLEIDKDPALTRLLQYARRDDTQGKGTISSDPIDRAFGLSGMIASLNKMYTQDPQKIVSTILPLLAAHYTSAKEHHVDLPREVGLKKNTSEYEEAAIQHGSKNIKVVSVVSDKPSMPTYLRSQQGPRADVVLQKSEATNHMCILSRQERKIDLSKVAALIRMREAQLQNFELEENFEYVGKTGRIDEVPYWYYDPATNSLLNGGPHNTTIQESLIPWDEMKKIVLAGLELN